MKNLITPEWVEILRKNALYCTRIIRGFEAANENGWLAFCDERDVNRLKSNPPHSSEDMYFEFWKDGVLLKRMWRGGQSYPSLKMWWQVRDTVGGILAPFESRRIYENEELEEIFNIENKLAHEKSN